MNAMNDLDLAQPSRAHIVGIGGAGMSAIASVLASMGHTVSGSDLKENPGLDRLRSQGIAVTIGHDVANVGSADFVAKSTAIPDRNVELVAASGRDLPVYRRAEVLRAITKTRRTIAVAGTHGKTTTSSMLAVALRGAGLDPSFIIGGEVNEVGGGAAWGAADLFVVEADESDGTFLELERDGAIITNVEPDHLEHYGGFDGLYAAFGRFLDETSGPLVVCLDDPLARSLTEDRDVLSYGTSPDARFRMSSLQNRRSGVTFTLTDQSAPGSPVELGRIELAVPGEHNARNAAAAVVMALSYDANFAAVAEALARFGGVARRYEHRGEAAGVTFVDDYAHLPTEVREVLRAARGGDWGRIVCVFQPHRYSRTQQVGRDFGGAFTDADHLVITDIYSAGEAPRPGISGKVVVDAVLDADPELSVAYLPHREDLIDYLIRQLRPGDLCLTLGAGDLTSVPDALRDALTDRPVVTVA